MTRSPTFELLPLGSVAPRGWLRDQLAVQASGLSGDLEEVWEELGEKNAWRGGAAIAGDRGPRYLSGLVPLARLTGRAELGRRAEAWIESLLRLQDARGAIGPDSNGSRPPALWWPVLPALKAACRHAEATGDARIVPLLERWFACQRAELKPGLQHGMTHYRMAGALEVGLWLRARSSEAWLDEHLRRLLDCGFAWAPHLTHGSSAPALALENHGVNVAMGLRQCALASLIDGGDEHRRAVEAGLDRIFAAHGQAHGAYSADTALSGREPTRGTELCAVVELMASLADIGRITGATRCFDRLEGVAYNALPAAFDGRMRFRQFLQQVNQVQCTRTMRAWSNAGPEANLFGFVAEDGCCTASYHEAWPLFVSRLWMRTRDGGLAAGVLGPSEVRTKMAPGVEVSIRERTQYPFDGRVTFEISASEAIRFPLKIRIPAWCDAARLDGRPATAGEWAQLEREWQDGDRVVLELPRRPVARPLGTGRTSYHLGPLLLALPVAESWEKLPGQGETYADHEVVAETPWNFALDPESVTAATVPEPAVLDVPYDEESPPLALDVVGHQVADWTLEKGVAAPIPNPVRASRKTTALQLVPYGATMLRIAAFPSLPGR